MTTLLPLMNVPQEMSVAGNILIVTARSLSRPNVFLVTPLQRRWMLMLSPSLKCLLTSLEIFQVTPQLLMQDVVLRDTNVSRQAGDVRK